MFIIWVQHFGILTHCGLEGERRWKEEQTNIFLSYICPLKIKEVEKIQLEKSTHFNHILVGDGEEEVKLRTPLFSAKQD